MNNSKANMTSGPGPLKYSPNYKSVLPNKRIPKLASRPHRPPIGHKNLYEMKQYKSRSVSDIHFLQNRLTGYIK